MRTLNKRSRGKTIITVYTYNRSMDGWMPPPTTRDARRATCKKREKSRRRRFLTLSNLRSIARASNGACAVAHRQAGWRQHFWVQNEQCTTCKKTSTRQRAVERVGAGDIRRHRGEFFLSNIFVSRIHPSIVARRDARCDWRAATSAEHESTDDAHSAHLDDDERRRRHACAPTTIDRAITRTDWTRKHVNHHIGPVFTFASFASFASRLLFRVHRTFSCPPILPSVLGVESTPWWDGFFDALT
jgi:hypothetical protein